MLPRHGAIGASVERLYLKALLLRQRNLTRIEALQIGHLTTERREVNEGVNFIGEQNGLLFVNATLVGTHLDKQVVARDVGASSTHLSPTLRGLSATIATSLLGST